MAVPLSGFHRGTVSFLGQGNRFTLRLTPSFSGGGLVSVLAACSGILPSVVVAVENVFKHGQCSAISPPLYIQSTLQSNPIQPTHCTLSKPHRYNHNAVHSCLRRPLRLRSVISPQPAATSVAYQSYYSSCCLHSGQPSSRRLPL